MKQLQAIINIDKSLRNAWLNDSPKMEAIHNNGMNLLKDVEFEIAKHESIAEHYRYLGFWDQAKQHESIADRMGNALDLVWDNLNYLGHIQFNN